MTDTAPILGDSAAMASSKSTAPETSTASSAPNGVSKHDSPTLSLPATTGLAPPASQASPRPSTTNDLNELPSPLLSPNSTTPVLEKPDLDFVGNVDVNDDLPTDKELKAAADLLVLDSRGQSRPFKDLYAGEGVAPRQLIIFVRHFFCGNCQEYLRTLSSSITPDDLLALETPTFITVIGCGRPELIEMYAETTKCPFPIYADPTRKLYDYLGMTRTLDLGKKKPDYIQSNIIVTSVQSIIQSLKTGSKALKGGDFKQVGGEFMFEDGEVAWVHRMRNTRDHAEVTQLRRVLGLDDAKIPIRKRWTHGVKEAEKKDNKNGPWGRFRSKSKGSKDGKASKEGSIKEDEMKLNGASTV